MDEISAINKMAADQLRALTSTPAAQTTTESFWGSSVDATAKYRPSSRTASTPLGSFLSKSHYSTDTRTPATQHERMLAAVYKAPATERRTIKAGERNDMSFDSSFMSMPEFGAVTRTRRKRTTRQAPVVRAQTAVDDKNVYNNALPAPRPRREMLSSSTKNQMVAIVFSGLSKLASALVFNWAREHKVPPELL